MKCDNKQFKSMNPSYYHTIESEENENESLQNNLKETNEYNEFDNSTNDFKVKSNSALSRKSHLSNNKIKPNYNEFDIAKLTPKLSEKAVLFCDMGTSTYNEPFTPNPVNFNNIKTKPNKRKKEIIETINPYIQDLNQLSKSKKYEYKTLSNKIKP